MSVVSTKFLQLVKLYADMDIEFPHLKTITVAQWLHESGKGTSDLFLKFNNSGGLKWREEMAPYGTSVSYKAHDGVDYYVAFKDLENFIRGYWRFIDRSPYNGWRNHIADPKKYIKFLHDCKYATDAKYLDGVYKHIPEAHALMEAAYAEQTNKQKEKNKVDILEFNCTNDGKPAITAYEGSTPKFTRFPKNRHEVDEFMKAFPNADIKVPDTSVKVIPRCPDLGEEKPEPAKPKPTGKRVRLDPGHSEKHVGARGKNSSVQEEDLNRFQAQCLKEELAKYGITADIDDPLDDDLWEIGKGAHGYDAFVSLHLNAFKKKEFYTTAMCHSRLQSPNSKSAKVASEWAIATATAIGNPIFSGTKGWPTGVMATGLSVLNGAANTNCPIAFLSELEFIDDETENGPIMERIRKGMKAGAKVLAEALA